MKYIASILIALAVIGCAATSPTSVQIAATDSTAKASFPEIDSIYVIDDMLCVDIINGKIDEGNIGGSVTYGKPVVQACLGSQKLTSSPPTMSTFSWTDLPNLQSATIVISYTINGVPYTASKQYPSK
jgi:hypothetical protein